MSRRLRLAALVVLVTGIALRWWVLRTPQGALNADESYTGLQAMEILRGDLPIVFEGQAYTAVPESYLFAPFAWLFGAHIVPLKLLASLLWGVTALLVYRILRPRLGNAWALAGAAFLWIAPGTSMVMSLRTYEGYASGMVIMLLAAAATERLLRADAPTVRSSAVVGALLGLLVYVHPMFVAVALPLGLVPAGRHRRDIRRWWLPSIAAAIAVNIPFLIWNIRNNWDSLDQPTAGSDSSITRIGRFFSDLMPRALGLRDFDGAWTLGRTLGIVLALVIVGVTAVGCVSMWRRGSAHRVYVVPVVLAWPVMSLFSNLEYVADGRYGMIVLPFVIIDLTIGLSVLARRIGHDPLIPVTAVVVAWSALLVVPWAVNNLGGSVNDPNADLRHVVDALDTAGIEYVAGNFWWVLPVEYATDGDIRGEVVGNPFVVRLPESHRVVQDAADDEVAFVFDSKDDDIQRLRLPIERYQRQEIGEAILYVPMTS